MFTKALFGHELTATPWFHVASPRVRTEDDIIYRSSLPSFADGEVVKTAGKTMEQQLRETPLSVHSQAALAERGKATRERAAAAQPGRLLPPAQKLADQERAVLSQRDSCMSLTANHAAAGSAGGAVCDG